MIEDLWYKNTVIYNLDLETFMDWDGDGVGDFEGLMRRLDYLHSLGVGTIWLAPFQRTPNRDNGYDISDYYSVDPRHGSGGDFVEFMHRAGKFGIRVVIDLVINHTSTRHLWFQQARRSKDSRFRDWYVWSKKRPADADQGMVFPGVQQRTWTYDKLAKQWYFHRFYDHQPDLNIDNPDVRTEIRRIMGFWLELGVAGFRVDAVPFIIESKTPGKKATLKFEYLNEMRRFLQWRSSGGLLLGEANVAPEEMLTYFGHQSDGLQMMFNFYVNQRLFVSLASKDARPLAEAIEATRLLPEGAQWANFLRNHDELDIGRLDEKQRQLVFDRYGPDKNMQLYKRGIRRRLAPMLGHKAQIELAYSLLFSLPGTPVIYYGDEIGMGDDLSLKGRSAVRTPMQWSEQYQAGFSTGKRTVRPVVDGGIYGYQNVNVENQRRDPASLLNWTTRMIRLRKECPEVGWGDYKVLGTRVPSVLAVRYDWRGESLVIVHNLSDQPQEARIKPGVEHGDRLVSLLKAEESWAESDGTHRIVLHGYDYRWYRVGSLNYALTRQRD